MGIQGNLLDTNVIIDFMAGRLPDRGLKFVSEIIDERPQISIITKIELLGYNAPEDEFLVLNDFVRESIVHPLNDEIATTCIELRKISKIKLPDAIIAATALHHSLNLLTRNVDDIKKYQRPLSY